MSLLIPITLFGWLPLTIFFFLVLKPHRAALFSVIGGTLFLPMAGFDLPSIPPFTKNTAIALGLILGGRFSGKRQAASFHWNRYDLPMLIWLFCPIVSSLANGLGWYDGISGVWENTAIWGIPYLAGRIYFDSIEKLRDLCLAIVIGGLLYLPLCLYEIRMSPQLSNMIYGFFPHSFAQHIRYGGFRPIVFMQHGLMVALWMASATVAAFWLWRSGEVKHLKGWPLSMLTLALAVTTVLCKSANGWIALALGCGGYLIYRRTSSVRPFSFLLLLIPCYIILRITGSVDVSDITSVVEHIFDAERSGSLGIRLLQEDLFISKTLSQPLLGWGGYGRGWPIDPKTGRMMLQMIDAYWLIVFNTRGIVGVVSLFSGMLIGPWLVLHAFRKKQSSGKDFSWFGPILLSLLVIQFMIDCLVNGMINPAFILISGALVSGYVISDRTNT